MLSRIIYGARTSLLLGVTAPAIAAVIGTAFGVTAGYFGGWIDRIIGRFLDIFLAFPALLLGILIAAALGAGLLEHGGGADRCLRARASPGSRGPRP